MTKNLFRLSYLHKRLDEHIRGELRKRWPDTVRLLRLRKLRLQVKARLTALVLKPAML